MLRESSGTNKKLDGRTNKSSEDKLWVPTYSLSICKYQKMNFVIIQVSFKY